jgi:hypothetical protein
MPPLRPALQSPPRRAPSRSASTRPRPSRSASTRSRPDPIRPAPPRPAHSTSTLTRPTLPCSGRPRRAPPLPGRPLHLPPQLLTSRRATSLPPPHPQPWWAKGEKGGGAGWSHENVAPSPLRKPLGASAPAPHPESVPFSTFGRALAGAARGVGALPDRAIVCKESARSDRLFFPV